MSSLGGLMSAMTGSPIRLAARLWHQTKDLGRVLTGLATRNKTLTPSEIEQVARQGIAGANAAILQGRIPRNERLNLDQIPVNRFLIESIPPTDRVRYDALFQLGAADMNKKAFRESIITSPEALTVEGLEGTIADWLEKPPGERYEFIIGFEGELYGVSNSRIWLVQRSH